MQRTTTTAAATAILASCAAIAVADQCTADPTRDSGILWTVTAASVASVDPNSVNPRAGDNAIYLSQGSCLGYFGPIGPYGPLGLLGPLGDGSWDSASYWISGGAMGSWDDFAKRITGMGGPLSALGPLGHSGPLTVGSVYSALPCKWGSFGHHLIGGGLWSPLGPLGPLGALGPLGPLGPIGAHGHRRDGVGKYVDSKGTVIRTVKVDGREFELFERYTQDYAASAQHANSADTSFMVDGTWRSDEAQKSTFTAKSHGDQLVTILVVPQYQLDSFSVTATDAGTKETIGRSALTTMMNWMQFRVRDGQSFKIAVNLEFSGHILSKNYFLYVVGSTTEFARTDITGPHMARA